MTLFKRNNKPETPKGKAQSASNLADIALNAIHDGVVITDRKGIIQYINPAAVQMTNCSNAHHVIGLDYGLVVKIESKEGREFNEQENPLLQAMQSGHPLDTAQAALIIAGSNQRLPVAISVQISNDQAQSRIITFRNITKELEEEGEQTEFISTASHEMRTPVATIDGYVSLALNPQTATIDERARNYLTAAQKASKHLGKLFQDLLDVTKLDDGHIRPHFVPVEMVELVQTISNDYIARAKEAKLNFTFGSKKPAAFGDIHRMSQLVYGYVDLDFIREIVDNLIENAIKYTPAGGSIYVNVRGDGDRVLINVTDTGIGISSEDLAHIFQKFYRVDNSDTREIGGNGLGLYIVKQRAEALGGKVWAESAFGEGSTFYVSLPRITRDEYEKRMIAVQNQKMMQPTQPASPAPAATPLSLPGLPQQQIQSAPQSVAQPTAQLTPQAAAQPTVQPTPQPTLPAQSPAAAHPAAPTAPAQQSIQAAPAAAPQPTPSTPAQPALATPQSTSPTPTTIPSPQPIQPLAPPSPIPPSQTTQLPTPTTPPQSPTLVPPQPRPTPTTPPPSPIPPPSLAQSPIQPVAAQPTLFPPPTQPPAQAPTTPVQNNINNLNGEIK